MPTITFFPIGNADCFRIDLSNGRKLLCDYANMRDPDDANDKRVDLATALRDDLKETDRSDFDVVVFTHLDDDHIHGASEFFHLEHATKYQGDDRIKIKEMWVPAGAIFDKDAEDEAAIIRAEARYRLKQGKGIRVFSRPTALKDWLESQGLTLASRETSITDAGQVVPGFTTDADGVEFFTHSPFASRLEDGDELFDRNTDAIVMQATFTVSGTATKFILGSDVDHEALSEIVRITKAKSRAERLEWDVFKLPHHCSYLSLSPEKGKDKTEPVENVKWLFETQGQSRGIVVSPSDPIPSTDTDQPPHRQAAQYQRDIASDRDGEFIVTMEHPKESAPEPLVITIDQFKATPRKRSLSVGAAVVSRPAPRAGVSPHRA
jgi:beta-lactamase superfamily II metal-dependent hydrolase